MLGMIFLVLSVARCSAKVPPPDMNLTKIRRVLAEEDVNKPIIPLTKAEQDVLLPLEASDCVAKFAALGYRIENFHKYARYFRDTSKIILSEAGEYVGAEDIEEYIRFVSDSSPYIKKYEILGATSSFKIADKEARTCTFVQQTIQKLGMDPEFGREATFLVPVMTKTVFEYDDNYISSIYVFYSKEFLSYFFGTLLNTDKTRGFICDVSSSHSCNATHISTNYNQCVSQLKDMPIFTNGAVDGKDYGCRVLHAAFAVKNARHCPHISFEPQEDSKGNIKCQESKSYSSSDYFDKEDMDGFFDFANDWDIDRGVGYAIIDMPRERGSTLQWCLTSLLSVIVYGIVWSIMRPKKGATIEDESDNKKKVHSNVLLENNQRRLGIILFIWIGVLLLGFVSAAIVIFLVVVKYIPDWDEDPYILGVPLHAYSVGKYHGSPGVFSDTTPQENMNDDQFVIYTGFVAWVTVLITGLGVEVFVWCNFIQDWNNRHENLWRFAQFIFPLMLLVSLGLAAHQNFIALPVMVAGLWKFGFPETLMFTYNGLFGKTMSRIQRSSDLIDGIGTILHHGAASFIISMMTVGLYPGKRCVFGPCLILIMQHWVVLVAYISPAHYTAIEIVLECYFEWTVISAFRELYHLHWTAALGAAVMLFAHWLYLTAALLKVIYDKDEENVYLRATSQMECDRLSTGVPGRTRRLSMTEIASKSRFSSKSRYSSRYYSIANRSVALMYNDFEKVARTSISMDNSDVHKNFGMKDDLDNLDGFEDDYDEKGL